jgi:hypothetical protein
MVANPNQRGHLSAAGQKDLSGVLSTIRNVSNIMEYQTYRRMTTSAWTTPRPFDGIRELGASIRFDVEPRIQTWKYQINQTLDTDVPDFEKRTLTFNQARYFNVKVDKTQLDNAEIRQYINRLTERAGMSLSEAMDPEVIRTAMASILPHMRGANAGVDRNINLGTQAAPRNVTGANIVSLIVDAALALQNTPSGSEWERGNMFILMPSMAQTAFMNSPFADLCCASGRESIVLGATLPNIAGFDVIFYDAPIKQSAGAGSYAYPVLFGSKSAVAFHQALTENDFDVKSERSFGRYFRGLMIHGSGVVYPKKLGLAIATFTA